MGWSAGGRQALGDQVAMALSHYGNKNDYKDYGVIWLLLTTQGACKEKKKLAP